METKRKVPSVSYHIPVDVLMDILRIALKNGLPHHIEGINDKQNIVIIRLNFPPLAPFIKKVKENIDTISI